MWPRLQKALTYMKISIQIPDDLASDVQRCAVKNGVTFDAWVETCLRKALNSGATEGPYQLTDCRVNGNGLVPAARAAGWPALLAIANER